ncbi:glycoside hydrolase family 68 protein [Actinotalea sp. K2]|uniref:glycoside hydrolase family 68 protein n=1 Tax=Actinotalea sp. K2 TaxID=2939438 RepID=UPI00201784C0|nr:glycoside hydrolase family 68 protein [Actinotalea sp. K2]MCL3861563.1 glycoside hydrolase family 68 protein [Actinotalea sp. K2]
MLKLADHWVWDSWTVHDGQHHHLFFLRASRALQDPDRRHLRASVGHARSTDLITWELLPDALVTADAPAWDDQATWTGSVIQAPDGTWRMFYTGVSRAEPLVQRVGVARSDDLITWHRVGDDPLLEADPRWYEKLDRDAWIDEAWRDPWVFADPDGHGWHMLLTARVREGSAEGRGVIGHATSPDLEHWEVQPPLTTPAGFGQLEVPQVAVVDGQPVLVFSCWPDRMDAERRSTWTGGGVWVVPGETLLGPWDIGAATAFDHPSIYAARLVEQTPGSWVLLGFRDTEDGEFIGEIPDPMPVESHGGTLRLVP